jgi:hypothetical protein
MTFSCPQKEHSSAYAQRIETLLTTNGLPGTYFDSSERKSVTTNTALVQTVDSKIYCVYALLPVVRLA